MLTVVWD